MAAKTKPVVKVQLDTPGLDGEDWPKRTNDRFPMHVLLGLPAPEGYDPAAHGEVGAPVSGGGTSAVQVAPTKPKSIGMGKRWRA